MSVLTVTLNPAIDQTVVVDRLTRGTVHRAQMVGAEPGGKGINVASCLADWGARVTATGLLGSDNAASFEALFASKGISDAFIRAPGLTRTNIKLVDQRDTTDLNFPGPEATPQLLDAVSGAVARHAGRGDLVVLAGSLPSGCPADHYARMTADIARRGGRVLLDASGPALAEALAGPVLPYAVKPNRHELSEWAGEVLTDPGAVGACAKRLQGRGIALVVVSMGAEGALFVSDAGTVSAQISIPGVASTVGAGDALVAGISAALTDDTDLVGIARLATAFAGARLKGAEVRGSVVSEIRALAGAISVSVWESA